MTETKTKLIYDVNSDTVFDTKVTTNISQSNNIVNDLYNTDASNVSPIKERDDDRNTSGPINYNFNEDDFDIVIDTGDSNKDN